MLILYIETETLTRKVRKMSNLNNEILLENLFEEALEMGLSEEVAEEWALEKFEDTPNPWD
jgi:hypothetical protein